MTKKLEELLNLPESQAIVKEEKEKANFDLLLSMPVTPTGDAPRAG